MSPVMCLNFNTVTALSAEPHLTKQETTEANAVFMHNGLTVLWLRLKIISLYI
jgi:hypothetical protein